MMRPKRILLTICLVIMSLCIGGGSYLEHQEKEQPKQNIVKPQTNRVSSNHSYKLSR